MDGYSYEAEKGLEAGVVLYVWWGPCSFIPVLINGTAKLPGSGR